MKLLSAAFFFVLNSGATPALAQGRCVGQDPIYHYLCAGQEKDDCNDQPGCYWRERRDVRAIRIEIVQVPVQQKACIGKENVHNMFCSRLDRNRCLFHGSVCQWDYAD